jgi:hypothetical protein
LSTFNSIGWEIHETALQRTEHQEKFNIKFIHYWLPVASHGSRNPEHPICLRCNRSDESQEQWHRCPNGTHKIALFCQDTTCFLQKVGLHPLLQDLVHNAIYSTPTNNVPELRNLFEQSRIGWSQFIRGRIGTQWVVVHNSLTNTTDGKSIFGKVISHILITHELWKQRNDDIHGQDPAIRLRHFNTFIVPRINILYSQKQLLPAHDQLILGTSLKELLLQPHHMVEKWVQTNEAYLLQSISRETKRLTTQNHNLTSFFTVTHTKKPPNENLSNQPPASKPNKSKQQFKCFYDHGMRQKMPIPLKKIPPIQVIRHNKK